MVQRIDVGREEGRIDRQNDDVRMAQATDEFRYDREAEAGGDETDQRRRLPDLLRDARGEAPDDAGAEDLVGEAGAFEAQRDQPLGSKDIDRNAAAGGEVMVGRKGHTQPFPPRHVGDEVGVFGRTAQDAQIRPVRLERRDLIVRRHLVDAHVHRPEPLLEGADQASERPGEDGTRHPDVQDACGPRADGPCPVGRIDALAQDRPGVPQEIRTGGRQGDASARPFEQGDADLHLEVADLLAQRRLRHAQDVGRRGEAEVLGDRHEITEVAQLHAQNHMDFE